MAHEWKEVFFVQKGRGTSMIRKMGSKKIDMSSRLRSIEKDARLRENQRPQEGRSYSFIVP